MGIRRVQVLLYPLYLQFKIAVGIMGITQVQLKYQLLGLESIGKTIIITDNYLFPQNYDFTYENDLKKVLCFLKAKEIRYYGNQNLLNNNFFQKIKQILKSVGTEITFYNISDFHDRFWINKDTLAGLVFGTSPNGIGRKLCYFDAITRDDAKTIIQYLEK